VARDFVGIITEEDKVLNSLLPLKEPESPDVSMLKGLKQLDVEPAEEDLNFIDDFMDRLSDKSVEVVADLE
jgi:hypothetical protein